MAKILYTDYHLPGNMVPTGKYFEMVDIPVPKIYSSKEEYSEAFIKQNKVEYVGIENRFNLVEIFSDMLTKLFENTNIDRNQIKYIFYTKSYAAYYALYGDGKYYGKNRDKSCINIPYYLTEKFQLRNTCIITNEGKCSSVTQAMDLGAMCCDRKKGYSLILTPSISERSTRYTNIGLIGDGAGLMLLGGNEEESDFEIIDSFLKTNGELSCSIFNSRDNLACLQDSISNVVPVHANYETMFRSEVLDSHGINSEDIKAVITLNLKYLVDKYNKLYPSKAYADNLPYGGHISDVDIIRNFKDFSRNSKLNPGDYFLLSAYGTDFTGLEYGGVLMRYRQNTAESAVHA